MKMVTLPSGAMLEIQAAPFLEAKALYQAILEEGRSVKIDGDGSVENAIKDLFCIGLSSKKIDAALSVCMKRVTYNSLKITDDTFEPVNARQDYLVVCFEVTRENIEPFTKSLYAQFKGVLDQLKMLVASVPA